MLSFSEKVSYAVGRFGSSITMDLADFFTGFVYYLFFGLQEIPFLAFLGVAVGKVVIGISCYTSGYISDRTDTRIGRRKPFVLIGLPIMAFAFFMLYNPHLVLIASSSEVIIFSYLLLFNSIYQFFYGFMITPYQSTLPEITETDEERLVVSGYQNTMNIFAFIVGAGTSFLLPVMIGTSDDYGLANLQEANEIFPFLTDGQVMTSIVLIFAIILIIAYIPFLIKIKEGDIVIPQPTLKEEIQVALSNKNFMSWTLSRSILQLAIASLTGILLAWIEEVLGLDEIGYILFGATLLIFILLGFSFWVRIGNDQRYGKTKSYIYSMSALIFVIPLMSIVGQIETPIPMLVQSLIVALLGALTLSCYYLLPYAITGDIAKEDELRTGESRAGMYYGFELIAMNFAQVVGYLLVGALLSLPKITNYLENEFSIGYLLFGPISSVIIFIAVLIFWKYVDADPLRKTQKVY
ncbi:MAG: MFS transporter [Candidatus Hodarchaeota archaeon]